MLDQVCQLARNAGDAIMQVYDGTKPMDVVQQSGQFSGNGSGYCRTHRYHGRFTYADTGYSGPF